MATKEKNKAAVEKAAKKVEAAQAKEAERAAVVDQKRRLRELNDAERNIRHQSRTSQQEYEDTVERRKADTVLSSNGPFTKVVRDGVVMVLPTGEVYSKEADEREEGLEVADSTVVRHTEGSVRDAAERKFGRKRLLRTEIARGMAEAKSEREVGEAETINEETKGILPSVDKPPLAGSELDAQILQPVPKEITEIADEGNISEPSSGDPFAQEDRSVPDDNPEEYPEAEFDLSNPRSTTLANLAAALEGLSDSDVKRARRKDDRAGAAEIYEKRLTREGPE